MNIGYIHCFNSYPPRSGGSVHVHQVTSRLVKRGHTIHVLDHEENPSFHKYPRDPSGIASLCANADVLYVRTGEGIEFEASNNCHSSNVPLIWEINAPDEQEVIMLQHSARSRTGLHLRSRYHLMRRSMERRRLARSVAAAVCVSRQLQDCARRYFGIQETFAIPNGSDPDMFTPALRAPELLGEFRDSFKVLWAGGTLWPWQGLPLIREVAQAFLHVDPKVVFVIIGKREYLRFEPTKNMVLIDEIPYFDVPKYFASADACLCLYEKYSWCKWGFYNSPLKLFDYMSSAQPVIASGFGQIREVIKDGENGFLTDNKVEDVVRQVLFLMHNPEKRREVGVAARRDIISYYNWERVAVETERVLEQVFESHHAS